MKSKIVSGLPDKMKEFKTKAADLQLELNALVIGRPVRITSDWNGQPYGRSKKSKKGQEFTVDGVHIDPHYGVSLRLCGEHLYIPVSEIEWL